MHGSLLWGILCSRKGRRGELDINYFQPPSSCPTVVVKTAREDDAFGDVDGDDEDIVVVFVFVGVVSRCGRRRTPRSGDDERSRATTRLSREC